ncbi:hypothetical protein INR49_004605 [Caranx melampygus]|nr:hypothetical protein INR49_004605 [Caranx melampygus]
MLRRKRSVSFGGFGWSAEPIRAQCTVNRDSPQPGHMVLLLLMMIVMMMMMMMMMLRVMIMMIVMNVPSKALSLSQQVSSPSEIEL